MKLLTEIIILFLRYHLSGYNSFRMSGHSGLPHKSMQLSFLIIIGAKATKNEHKFLSRTFIELVFFMNIHSFLNY